MGGLVSLPIQLGSSLIKYGIDFIVITKQVSFPQNTVISTMMWLPFFIFTTIHHRDLWKV